MSPPPARSVAAPATPHDPAQRELQGHVALMVVQLCFGLFPLFGKWAFDAFAPTAVAAWRLWAGTLAFLIVAVAVHRRRVLIHWRDLPRVWLCALLGVALNQAFYLEGLQRTTALNAGLLMMLIPVFTTAVAVAVRQESFVPRRALGILIAFGGATALALEKGPDLGEEHALGNALLVANTLAYSFYLVLSRPLLRRYPPLVMIFWAYALSLPCLPLFALDAPWVPAEVPPRAWVSLGLILLLPTVLGYMLNLYALARVPASTTAVYVLAQPLITGCAGVLLLGERLRATTAAAGAGIVLGLALVLTHRRSMRP